MNKIFLKLSLFLFFLFFGGDVFAAPTLSGLSCYLDPYDKNPCTIACYFGSSRGNYYLNYNVIYTNTVTGEIAQVQGNGQAWCGDSCSVTISKAFPYNQGQMIQVRVCTTANSDCSGYSTTYYTINAAQCAPACSSVTCNAWSTCSGVSRSCTSITAIPSGCSIATMPNQSCSNGGCSSTHYNCSSGTLGTFLQGGSSWAWQCLGSNGGTNTTCTENFPTCSYSYGDWGICNGTTKTRTVSPLNSPCIASTTITSEACSNGGCSSIHYNCSSGTLGTFLQGGSSWAWQCLGSNGGTDTTCTENFPTCTYSYGEWSICDNDKETRTRVGSALSSPCIGDQTITETEPCLMSNGQCGAANNTKRLSKPSNTNDSQSLCLDGSSPQVNYNSQLYVWYWACSGKYGGTSSDCIAKKVSPIWTEK